MISRQVANRILSHAQASPDSEVCGLIAGTPGHATHAYPITNIAPDPSSRFRLAPKSQIDALRQMRERAEALVAIYHSHPHGPAAPSAIDLREASYPEAVYLIVSLDTKGVLDLRGFRLANGVAGDVELELE
jgi:proteasome lid subunit RPN8/RPN11